MTKISEIKKAFYILKDYFRGEEELVVPLNLLENKIKNLQYSEATETFEDAPLLPLPPLYLEQGVNYFLFTDGACRGNPGPGAWAGLAQDVTGLLIFELSGFSEQTTNNRMELLAGLEVLRKFLNYYTCQKDGKNGEDSEVMEIDQKSKIKEKIALFSDSKYLVNGVEKWMEDWKKRGWKKSDKKDPENLDLWIELDNIIAQYKNLTFIWVKGHSGHAQNERCDYLANKCLDNNLY
jgi:ribonuclease HI